ncbi:LysR family transcriptional regulator [Chelativorans intermedius]|uniref:LysR family transcriptional regulator n=1 Tax=Chelativorans intermedius TaxID=515947 RepID=A0ABV6D486_9HYPH|nr:LysR family transcriptional regulator [Chelativorans intermedius]MCT8997658.1 LysR family transcriptional regulator [Chelativorans intermedius]
MNGHRQDGLSFATLRAAEAVIDTKSLTGAALKLGISQPAISMHLGRLERAIGTSLIKRVGNRIIVKEEISRLIRQMLELERRLKTVGYERSLSRLKLGVCTYCAPLLAERGRVLGRMRDALTLRVADSRRLEEMYEEGEVDAVFRALYPLEVAPELTAELSFEWVGTAHLADFAGGRQGLPLVLPAPHSPLGALARDWLREHEIVYDVIGEVDDIMTAVGMVAGGLAVSPLPPYLRDSPPVDLDGCVGLLPGRLQARYGMFFDERRFSLRTALDIFELVREALGEVPPPIVVARQRVANR